jgi:hypothetical protein
MYTHLLTDYRPYPMWPFVLSVCQKNGKGRNLLIHFIKIVRRTLWHSELICLRMLENLASFYYLCGYLMTPFRPSRLYIVQ